jgi:pyruvate,water dikinase
MIEHPDVRWFADLRSDDIATVGGKNAALGELYSVLSSQGVQVPNGFALTADLYRSTLTDADAWPRLGALLASIRPGDVKSLAVAAAKARTIVYDATGTARVRAAAAESYARLEQKYGKAVAVAVRSSATAEDLPTASFAGQHESFLNVRGVEALFEACRLCFASVFTDRAIVYRNDNGFDHLKIGLSVGVMKMVRSDRAASGVAFTLDTESGFRDVVFVTGAYGLGENVVQGRVDPDEFYVHKPTFRAGHRCVLRRSLGSKQQRLIYGDERGHATLNIETPSADRERFCIPDRDVLTIADFALSIEDHFSRRAGHAVPMDIEWAKDGVDGEIYVVQARPETVASRKVVGSFESYRLTGAGPVVLTGRAVGEKIAHGPVRRIANSADLATFQPGAGCRHHQPGLGTGDEAGCGDRHQSWRENLPCRHRGPGTRHSGSCGCRQRH